MRTHGFNPSEEDLRDMIRNVDKNANGAIDFNEFIEMMLKQGENVKNKEIIQCWGHLILIYFILVANSTLTKMILSCQE